MRRAPSSSTGMWCCARRRIWKAREDRCGFFSSITARGSATDLGAVSSDFVASVRGSIEELSDAVRTLGDVIVETGQRLHDQARRIAEAEDQTVAAMTKIGEGFGGHP